eukprot:5056130-Ditylum_brightwellii.AAC.1
MLPIHLAFRNNTPDTIIATFLSAYPSGINVKDRKGRIPIECALSSNTEESNRVRATLIQTYAKISVESERSAVVSESNTSFEQRMNALKSELNNSAGQEKARVIQREIADSSKIHDLSTALEKRLHEVSNLKSDLSAREEEIESLRNKVSELTITLEE